MNENYFMGLDGFVWFVGVVENRNDPAKLGRVQVRCLGYHTEDLVDIPSKDLPWAHVMHPVTDPSMQGLGNSPTFLVEGSWVVGFFRDANEKQQPIIMGSLPGVPIEAGSDFGGDEGFIDPNGKYPALSRDGSNHSINESDVSRLARGEDAETHKSLIDRRKNVEKKIETAVQPGLSPLSTEFTTITKRGDYPTYAEPNPRGVETTGTSTGAYPFNHVHESESGHISEIDDTPGGERLYRQHKKGTFEEITNDGRVTKVYGDDYVIIKGASNIYIDGDANITTEGTRKDYIKGDYILDVKGNFTRKIGKTEAVKIGADGAGNLEEVILGNHGYNISGAVKGAIGTNSELQSRDFDLNIGGNFGTNVGGDHFITSVGEMSLQSTTKNVRITALSNIGLLSLGKIAIVSRNDMSIKSVTKLNIKSDAVGSMIFAGSGSTINLSGSGSTITTTQEVTANTIALTTHTHTDTAGLAANITSAPNA